MVALALVAVAAEALTAHHHRRPIHARDELLATAGVALGHAALRLVEAGIVAVPMALAAAHRPWTIDASTWSGALGLFLAYEFAYYWYHRAAHRVRWLWATHAVHHSTTRLNLTAALRLGWTGAISGHFLFFLPLVAIGFSPTAVAAMATLDLVWQFFIHTEMVPSLGVLEAVLDTPRHHAVHHARNEACLDRNFGGILIVFDRLFGTFAAAPPEPLVFGLVGRAPSTSVLAVVFGEWRRLFADLRRAPSLAAALTVLFGPPGAGSLSLDPPRPSETP
ncbi:MAG: sterol desaturase family protein [Phyllobacteriaceae bacterium]|nr:sterol desaturase family protein [Phyllobacteriaceae bacterium]